VDQDLAKPETNRTPWKLKLHKDLCRCAGALLHGERTHQLTCRTVELSRRHGQVARHACQRTAAAAQSSSSSDHTELDASHCSKNPSVSAGKVEDKLVLLTGSAARWFATTIVG
jgi:hypothetical protein